MIFSLDATEFTIQYPEVAIDGAIGNRFEPQLSIARHQHPLGKFFLKGCWKIRHDRILSGGLLSLEPVTQGGVGPDERGFELHDFLVHEVKIPI